MRLLRAAAFVAVLAPSVLAQSSDPSGRNGLAAARFADALPVEDVQRVSFPGIDLDAVLAEDVEREQAGEPPRFAIPFETSLSPFTSGTLELVEDDTLLWRVRVFAPQAASINLGFGQYRLPAGAELRIQSFDGEQAIRPFTHLDNEDHGELWTPIVRADEVVVELSLPVELFTDAHVALELTQVGHGYRGFHTKRGGAYESGSCNIDVACPESAGWENEIPSVGVISTGGSTFCTGFMVNNTANDRTPYFMTANHCGIGGGNAPSLVVYWNYETSVCGGNPDGVLSDFNSGSTHLASYSPSDFTLVELDDDPDEAFGVTFAGWDRSGVDTSGAIAIHHPSTDEKRISFELQPTTTTSYLADASPGDGTHVRVEDWDVGTTEPGSSGSPLFDPNHRVIGQLHGGFAACGNDLEDWYGRISVSWNGGGSPSSRLSDWLDPGNTGAMAVDTLGTGLSVSPSGAVVHEGPTGGPFTNATTTYTLTNTTQVSLDWSAALSGGLALLLDGGVTPLGGTLAPGAMLSIDVTLDPSTASLGAGVYSGMVTFDDITNGITSTREHVLEAGRTTIHAFTMDSDPGWNAQGLWEHGAPTGNGGVNFGLPDPSSGATGNNVYGYNLAGDYGNNLGEVHLTSAPINCKGTSGVRVRFQRWLNVEQPLYDHAYFRVSTDGVNFTTIWENGSEITDSAWVPMEFDISAIADGAPNVWLRWTQGTTDGSWEYAGWNVDDVEISAVVPSTFELYGAGHPGSGGFTPKLQATGDTAPGQQFSVFVTEGLGRAFTFLAVGTTSTSVPFFGGPGTLLVDGLVATVPAFLTGPPNVPGVGTFGLNVVFTTPDTAGTDFFLQAWVADPGSAGGTALSNGLRLFANF